MRSSKEWISISDMMTGLMMVFLFLSILYMHQIQEKSKEYIIAIEKIKKLSVKHTGFKNLVLEKLNNTFQPDLKNWNAEIIDKSLLIRFLSPDIMFNPMESVIKKEFKNILNNFCPRYFSTLYELRNNIEEVRIEGHTSHEWGKMPKKEAYFKNMELSQDRTRSVLHYCVTINTIEENVRAWIIKTLTANGFSSSRPICQEDTVRCRTRNRRVDFRILINESQVLEQIDNTILNK